MRFSRFLPIPSCRPGVTEPWRSNRIALDPLLWDRLEAGLERFPPILSGPAGIGEQHLGWRIAVLPFRSAGSPMGHAFALGMAEEISAALSRFSLPRLVASATFWDGTEPVADAMNRSRDYRLNYLVDGEVAVAGDDVTVHVTLLDVVLDFEVIWSGRFRGSMHDLFSLQARIGAAAVAVLDPDLFQRGSAHGPPRRTDNATAHHAVLRAIGDIYRLERLPFMHALSLLTEAVRLDPGYAAAYTWLAYWCLIAVGQGWVEKPEQVTALAGRAARRAVALDPLDARATSIAGHVEAYLLGDVATGHARHERALELNPNLPVGWALSALCRTYVGQHSTAIRHARAAVARSPRDPHLFLAKQAQIAGLLFNRQMAEADLLSETVLRRRGKHLSALNLRLAVLGHRGRQEEAAACLATARSIEPALTVGRIVGRAPLRPRDADFYAEGLRKAGVPE